MPKERGKGESAAVYSVVLLLGDDGAAGAGEGEELRGGGGEVEVGGVGADAEDDGVVVGEVVGGDVGYGDLGGGDAHGAEGGFYGVAGAGEVGDAEVGREGEGEALDAGAGGLVGDVADETGVANGVEGFGELGGAEGGDGQEVVGGAGEFCGGNCEGGGLGLPGGGGWRGGPAWGEVEAEGSGGLLAVLDRSVDFEGAVGEGDDGDGGLEADIDGGNDGGGLGDVAG